MDSSDDDILCVKRKSCSAKVMDSDSDSDNDNDNETKSRPQTSITAFSHFEHSDADDEVGNLLNVCGKKKQKGGRKRVIRPKFLVEEESNDEEIRDVFNLKKNMDHNDVQANEDECGRGSSVSSLEKKTDDTTHNGKLSFNPLKQSDLYDAEESDEERPPYTQEGSSNDGKQMLKSRFSGANKDFSVDVDNKVKRHVSNNSKKSRQKERKSKTNAIQEIHRETQRLIRESSVSLPYHKPRQRTLAEFLKRRESYPIPPVKLTSENIHLVCKTLEERIQTAEEFFRSESEEDSDNNNKDVSVNRNQTDTGTKITTDVSPCSNNTSKTDAHSESVNEPDIHILSNGRINEKSGINITTTNSNNTAVSSNAGIPVDVVDNACTSSIIDDVNKTKTDGSGSCVITKHKAFSIDNNYEIKNDEDVSDISIDMNNDKMKLDTSTISIITEAVNSEEVLKNGIYHVSENLRHKEIVPPDVVDNACTGFITPQIDNHWNDNCITKETFSIDHSFNKGLEVVSNYDKSIVCDSVSNIEDVPTKTKFSLVNHFSNFSRDIDETNLNNELMVTSDNRSRPNSHTVSSIIKKISMDLVNFDDNACTDAVAGVNKKHSNSHGQLTDNTSDFHLHCGDYQSVSDRIQHLQADRKDSNSVDQLTETTSNFHLHYDNFQSVSASVDRKESSLPYQMTENTSDFHLHYEGTQSVSNPIQAHPVDRKGSSLHDQLTENTSDFHLQYGDTRSVSDPIQPPPLNKKDNSSHDQLTENTSDFHLLYSESQSPSDPIKDASQEMKRLQEKYLTKQPESDSNKNCQQEGNEDKNEQLEYEVKQTIGDKLQQIIRRSLPGLGDIAKLKPKLSGAPNEMINLDDELPKKGGVINLVQRLIKHSARGHPPKKERVELGVVSVDSEDIVHKDIMSYTMDDEIIDDNPELAKPGAKHKKLKDELQQQIFKMRAKEWAERTHERKLEDEELSDCKMDDVLDEIEKILEPDVETESEEEGEEEEDVPIVERKRTKSGFVEDEADVSDDCDRFSDESESADETDDVESDDIGCNTDDGNASRNATLSDSLQDSVAVVAINSSDSCTDIIHKNEEFLLKSLDSQKTESSMTPLQFPKVKMCITPDQTSSVSKLDSRSQAYEQTDSQNNQMYRLERSKTFDLFISQDEDYIPPYQIQSITPRMNSEESLMKCSQEASPFPMNETPSPLTARSSFQASGTSMPKKLFAYSDSTWTQDNMSELLGLCSGQFPGNLKTLVNTQRDTSRADLEDELVGLCSGKFETQPKTATQGTNLEDLCSGKFPTQSISRNNAESDQSQNESVKNSMPSQHSDLEEEDEKVATKPLKFFDSDEDSEEEKQEEKNGTRKRNRQLHFSDDELDQDDDAKSDISDARSDRTEQLVEYDSEENEIPRGRGAAEFFENEAELSENDWASADEDEQGLDDFEQEEGDDEALDHHKLKEQLGKIHMRRQLDEDRREVHFLQEMLLEDGELHSEGGRERKFRWKNVDNVDNNDFVHQDSDNEVVDEEDVENEEQWRKARHEREMFLQKQKKEESDLLLDENDSQLLLLGKAALKRMSSFEQTLKIKQNNSESSPDPNHPYKLLTKRGSFLARGDRELARIAEIAAGTKDGPVLGPKNTRNFVFATLSPEKKAVEAEKVQLKKRPAASGSTPSSVKRSRFSKENSRGLRLLDLLSQS